MKTTAVLDGKNRKSRKRKNNKSRPQSIKKPNQIADIYKAAIENKDSIEKEIGVSPIDFSVFSSEKGIDTKILIVSVKEIEDLEKIPQNIKIPLASGKQVVVYLLGDANYEHVRQARLLFA